MKTKRKSSESVAFRNRGPLNLIESIKADHHWGYRRILATIRHVHGHVVNLKRVYRHMWLDGLTVRRDERLRVTRTPRPKPSPDKPNQIWGIFMTTIMTDRRQAFIVIVLDCTLKDHRVLCESKCLTGDWLSAL